MDVLRGETEILTVEMPPRHGKCEYVSVHLPAWYLGRYPAGKIIVTSATDALAQGFSRRAKDLVRGFGPSLFGIGVSQEVRSKRSWQTTTDGALEAAGINGDIIGRGADLLIVDDYCKTAAEARSETWRKACWEWFTGTAMTRLSPQGKVIVVATRWHKDDLIGQIQRSPAISSRKFQQIKLAGLAGENDPMGREPGEALWPEQYSREYLERRRALYSEAGTQWLWSALYDQEPPDMLDTKWPADYFHEGLWFEEWPDPQETTWKVLALDPSCGERDTSAYSAYVMLAVTYDGTMWVDADLARRNVLEIVEDGIAHTRAFNQHTFVIETIGFQASLDPLFRQAVNDQNVPLTLSRVNHHKMSKDLRIETGLTEPLARGRLRFKMGSPGAHLLVEQLKAFPSEKYKDGPDALEMAVTEATRLIRGGAYEEAEEDEEQGIWA